MKSNLKTLFELDVKPGDVVACYNSVLNGAVYNITEDWKDWLAAGDSWWCILFRNSSPETPKPLKDMTDAEIGAFFRAHHEGGVIELFCGDEFGWLKWDYKTDLFDCHQPVRIRPEPARETVTLYWRKENHAFCIQSGDETHRITFDLINGKPFPGVYTDEDGNTMKIEEL